MESFLDAVLITGGLFGVFSLVNWVKEYRSKTQLIKNINGLIEEIDTKYEVAVINAYDAKKNRDTMDKFNLCKGLGLIVQPVKDELISLTKTLRNMGVRTITFHYKSKFFGNVVGLINESLSDSYLNEHSLESGMQNRFETAIKSDVENRFPS